MALGPGGLCRLRGVEQWDGTGGVEGRRCDPALHPCTPTSSCEDQLRPGDGGRAGPRLTARAPQGLPQAPGAGEGLLWVTLVSTPESDILPVSPLECDRVS